MTIYIKNQKINSDYVSANCDVNALLPYLIEIQDTNFYIMETADSLTAEDHEIINNNKIDMVLYMFFTHVTNAVDYLNDPNITVITWDYNTKFKNHLYCPYFAFDDWFRDVDAFYSNRSNKKQFTFSCLNNLARPQRVAVMYKLYELTNFQNSIVSLSKTCLYTPYEFLTLESLVNKVSYFTEVDETIAKDLYDILPIQSKLEVKQDGWKLGKSQTQHPNWQSHPAYYNSYFNLVTETDWNDSLLSEKTFKPIISQQFFILAAGHGSVNLLRNLGFDVYDDIIDHGYDDCASSIDRFRLIFEEFQRLLTLDWPTIYRQTYERRHQNKQLLFSGQIKKHFLANFEAHIKLNRYRSN